MLLCSSVSIYAVQVQRRVSSVLVRPDTMHGYSFPVDTSVVVLFVLCLGV